MDAWTGGLVAVFWLGVYGNGEGRRKPLEEGSNKESRDASKPPISQRVSGKDYHLLKWFSWFHYCVIFL